MAPQEEYKVQLEVFEGPLDLLLYLIKKDELDIYDIPIERITAQYTEYLNLMRMLDLNIAGEFLVMAATLMMIKSRLLLPPEERGELEPEEEDPRWDLVRQLVEYKKFKDAALHLEGLEERQKDVFTRGSDAARLGPAPEVALHEVSIFDLISAFNEVLKKVKAETLTEIFAERVTVAEKIEMLAARLREEKQIPFSGLFLRVASRQEIVCTFLAILELIRLRQVVARQENPFGEILICRSDPA
jgi:segregation and condensation protein A